MVKPLTGPEQIPAFLEERACAQRLREAIQWCKVEEGFEDVHHDMQMKSEARMTMERCLTKNFLVAKGTNYFGKRDLIYIDMIGQDEVASLMKTQ